MIDSTPHARQKWPESLFQTPTPLLFQNFGLRDRIRVRLLFKFENPSPVQTPATIIDPTVIYPCFYLRNDHTDSCYCRNGKVTPGPGPVFHMFLTPDPGPKEKRRILPELTPVIRIRSHLWCKVPSSRWKKLCNLLTLEWSHWWTLLLLAAFISPPKISSHQVFQTLQLL